MHHPPATSERWSEALAACRSALGLGGPEHARRVVKRKFDFDEATADACCRETFAAVSAEFAEEKANPRPKATEFYRELKQDEDATWPTRLNAQRRLDDLWELIDLAQSPDGQIHAMVVEAYAFYYELLAANDASQATRSRARARIDLLMHGRRKRSRSSSDHRASTPVALPREQLRHSWQREYSTQASDPSTAIHTLGAMDGSSIHARDVATSPRSDASPSTSHAKPSERDVATLQPRPPKTASPIPANHPYADVYQQHGDDILSAELRAEIERRLAVAPADADPFMIAMDTYLDHKFPETSPSEPTSGSGGQSSDASARAPPGDESAA